MSSVPSPCFYESHMHTELCKHAQGTPDEYAAEAIRQGLLGMTVTCHCPLPDGINANVRMQPEQMAEYVQLVTTTADRWRDRLDVRLGLESDYFPPFVSWLEQLHDTQDFSYILGSVHPQASYYQQAFPVTDIQDFHRLYYHYLAEAAETGLFDCLSHPDLVKNTQPQAWRFTAIQEDVARSLDRIARTGVSMELNTSGLYKNVQEFNPGRAQLEMMHERGITVVVGADAHSAARVGDQFPAALQLLQDVGYRQVSIYLDRTRHDLDIERVQASLAMATPSFDSTPSLP